MWNRDSNDKKFKINSQFTQLPPDSQHKHRIWFVFSIRVGLKTRWTTRSDQRTVFTDSLHLFLCGLASKDCTAALVDLAQGSGRAGVQNWVLQRQALVLKLLKNLCSNNTLTGPKVESTKVGTFLFTVLPLCPLILSCCTPTDTGPLPLYPREPGPETGQHSSWYQVQRGAA